MTEKTVATTTSTTEKTAATTSRSSLAPAGESSNPEVHTALAHLQAARDNRSALDVDEPDVKAADAAVKAAEKALADLGYEA
jgi:hypothetical protein